MKTLTNDTPKYLNTRILKFRLHHNDTCFIMITLVKFETDSKMYVEVTRHLLQTFFLQIFYHNCPYIFVTRYKLRNCQ